MNSIEYTWNECILVDTKYNHGFIQANYQRLCLRSCPSIYPTVNILQIHWSFQCQLQEIHSFSLSSFSVRCWFFFPFSTFYANDSDQQFAFTRLKWPNHFCQYERATLMLLVAIFDFIKSKTPNPLINTDFSLISFNIIHFEFSLHLFKYEEN